MVLTVRQYEIVGSLLLFFIALELYHFIATWLLMNKIEHHKHEKTTLIGYFSLVFSFCFLCYAVYGAFASGVIKIQFMK